MFALDKHVNKTKINLRIVVKTKLGSCYEVAVFQNINHEELV